MWCLIGWISQDLSCVNCQGGMENLGDYLQRHQEGEGYQALNDYHLIWRIEDEQRWIIQLILWKVKWSGNQKIELGWEDRTLQSSKKDP